MKRTILAYLCGVSATSILISLMARVIGSQIHPKIFGIFYSIFFPVFICPLFATLLGILFSRKYGIFLSELRKAAKTPKEQELFIYSFYIYPTILIVIPLIFLSIFSGDIILFISFSLSNVLSIYFFEISGETFLK